MISIDDKSAKMSGSPITLCAEASLMLFYLHQKLREDMGKEAADALMRDAVSIIEPGSPMRKEAKKYNRRGKHD